MEPEQGVFPIWKRLGETPLEALSRFRSMRSEYADVPMTYAGRLDPAAEGVLIVLAGDARFKRDDFLGLDKEYRFDVVWGISTDTYDLLGMPDAPVCAAVSSADAIKATASLRGDTEQAYPPYSSKTVSGKPLFQWARENRLHEIDIPIKRVTVSELAVTRHYSLSLEELLAKAEEKIESVRGDFRQNEIAARWKGVLKGGSDSFSATSFRAVVSSGTYVRGLARDMGAFLGCGGTVLSIVRTRVGPFEALP